MLTKKCIASLTWLVGSPSINLSSGEICFALLSPVGYYWSLRDKYSSETQNAIKWLLHKPLIKNKKKKVEGRRDNNAQNPKMLDFFVCLFIFSLGIEPGDYSHLWNGARATKPPYSRMGGYSFVSTMSSDNFFSYTTDRAVLTEYLSIAFSVYAVHLQDWIWVAISLLP